MRKQLQNKMSGPSETKGSLEQRVAELEALLDSDPKFRAKRMGLPVHLTREQYSALHADATYTPDPLGSAEQKVMDKFKGPIAEAAAAEELARQSFEDAHQSWSVAHVEQSREARKLGDDVRFTPTGQMVVPEGSPLAAAKARTAELWEEREGAGQVLAKARLKHSKFIHLRGHALRAARDGGRSTLEAIRDRVLG